MNRPVFTESDRPFRMATRSLANVLITGPTGAGKSLLAKRIHQASARAGKPFVCINLATLHSGTFESELFGHERGAYTGAEQRRVGKLELAHGGTVFLDEIGELSLPMQSRLLEFLQSRSITPMGSNREQVLDARVIAATHRNLEEMVRQGQFREDLLHRLRVLSIRLPSLSEMPERFDEVVHSMLAELSVTHKRPVLRLAEEVASRLEAHSWPGNFRELRNVLEYAVLSSENAQILLEDLPDWFGDARPSCGEQASSSRDSKGDARAAESGQSVYMKEMEEFERHFLARSLRRYHGRISLTSRRLQMSKTTLLRRMKALRIAVNPDGEVVFQA